MAGPLQPDDTNFPPAPAEGTLGTGSEPEPEQKPELEPAPPWISSQEHTAAPPFDIWAMPDPLAELEDQPAPEPMPPPAPLPPPAPVASGERVDLIDSMRGFALLGILLMNMSWFAWPPARHFGVNLVHYTSRLDEGADLLLRFLCEGKFYIIFSFLFGLGMAVQKERIEARGGSFFRFFIRRMFWLSLIGAVHGIFIWSGDILVTYAMAGIVLLLISTGWSLFRKLLLRIPSTEDRNSWPGTPLLGAFFLLGLMFLGMVGWIIGSESQTINWHMVALEESTSQIRYQADLATYKFGSYLDTLNLRIAETERILGSFGYLGVLIMASFLFGAFTWRARLFTHAERHRRTLRTVFLIGLPVGIVTNAVYVAMDHLHLPQSQNWLGGLGQFIGQYALGYAYLVGLALLHLSGRAANMFQALAPVGRMALTSYLTHSVVLTLVFNGYGLGLMGEIGETSAYLIGFAVFALQMIGSAWWLQRFRFGPVEWLWRSLTYLKLQPMRRQLGAAQAADL